MTEKQMIKFLSQKNRNKKGKHQEEIKNKKTCNKYMTQKAERI